MKPRPVMVFLMLGLAVMMPALACNFPTTGTPTPTLGVITQVALTVAAELAGTGTSTAQVSATSSPVGAIAAVAPSPSATRPQVTRISPTATSQPCNEAAFLQDVTIADGTKMTPGQAFTKTWRLRNIGTCTWTSAYAVVFVSGEAMGAPAVVNLKGDVAPNDLVDFSIDMKAPPNLGKYSGFWKLRSPEGVSFGVSGIDQPFFIQIEVIAPTVTPTVSITPTTTLTPVQTVVPGSSGVIYNLADNFCQAEWRSQSGSLNCPGVEGDAWGYAIRLTNPRLENDSVESAPVLLTFPDTSANGAITGKFPALAIQPGYRFQAALGCVAGATSCSVVYQLNFVVGSAQAANLGQWTHTYSGTLESVDVDLSALAGQQVQIILAVLSNGSADGDQAVWVNPRIVKP